MTTKEYEKIIKMVALSIIDCDSPKMSFNSFGHGYAACIKNVIKKLEKMYKNELEEDSSPKRGGYYGT